MRRYRYPDLLTQKEILNLLKWRVYSVDEETGIVTGQKNNTVATFSDEDGYLFVRLYWNKKRRAISVSKLVWMKVTKTTIPKNFEIHHRDENVTNNAWTNLLCIHEKDHDKLHSDMVPF